VVPLVWLPIAAYFAQPWAASVGYSPLACAAVLAGGLLFWSLAEYSVHRFLFHVDAAVPDVGAALLLHFLLHGIHHKVPMDRYRLVMPPVLFAALAVTGYSLLAPLAALAAVAPPLFNALFGAVLVGYVGYDLMHYSQHHVHFSRTSYFGQMKSYHMKHHFSGQENVGFGITNTLWDHVFGTLLDVNKKPSASAQADEARMLEAIDGGGKSS
jgi:4-hydroxysphinganine ceramide fatty acyl 2-hydroxylase